MKLSLHCTCGSSSTGTIKPDSKAQTFIDSVWNKLHPTGPDHQPCDAKTAAKVRRKLEKEENHA